MGPGDVRTAIEWAEREGWQPGLEDAGPFRAADPGGFFAAQLGDRLVSMISVVRAGPGVAFIGFYIVDPELRGTGLGKPLWDAALSGFEGVTLGADAVPEQVANYETEGFQVAYRNARFSSPGLKFSDGTTSNLVEATEVPFADLVEFDAGHFFGPRPEFLRLWVSGPGRESLVATGPSGEITGFAASRSATDVQRIGPVFAGDRETARDLILALAGRAAGPVAVDVPLPNREAVDLLESFGMERSFETARIYRGPAPDLPLERIFGVTSLELG